MLYLWPSKTLEQLLPAAEGMARINVLVHIKLIFFLLVCVLEYVIGGVWTNFFFNFKANLCFSHTGQIFFMVLAQGTVD